MKNGRRKKRRNNLIEVIDTSVLSPKIEEFLNKIFAYVHTRARLTIVCDGILGGAREYDLRREDGKVIVGDDKIHPLFLRSTLMHGLCGITLRSITPGSGAVFYSNGNEYPLQEIRSFSSQCWPEKAEFVWQQATKEEVVWAHTTHCETGEKLDTEVGVVYMGTDEEELKSESEDVFGEDDVTFVM